LIAFQFEMRNAIGLESRPNAIMRICEQGRLWVATGLSTQGRLVGTDLGGEQVTGGPRPPQCRSRLAHERA
jgi:hypothetical protein